MQVWQKNDNDWVNRFKSLDPSQGLFVCYRSHQKETTKYTIIYDQDKDRLDVATYKGGTDAKVTVEDKTKELVTLSDTDIAEMTQARVETLLIVCDVLLHKETGYYLKDIGFNRFS